ncbi:unnamed protein product [Rodentolepis nana]|uniref:Aquaporin-like protein n=1 Tax=Rodentolepis nana TaxID=102285 RepID=A0A158QIH0_RODNA|nr:unnamed protein product [Rodentolepis nana]
MNPTRSLAAAIIQNNYDRLWIYFAGPILGSVVACFFYELVICPKASLRRTQNYLCSSSFDRKVSYESIEQDTNTMKAYPHYTEYWKMCQIFIAEVWAAGVSHFPSFLFDTSEPNLSIVAGVIAGASYYVALWYSFPVSGAQVSPTFTLAALITRRLPFYLVPLYVIADFLGTLLAISISWSVSPFADQAPGTYGMTLPGKGVSNVAATFTEAGSTFILISVGLASLDEMRDREWRPEYGAPFPLAIMVTIIVNVATTIHISGASMNPARSLAAAIIQNNYDRLWMGFFANLEKSNIMKSYPHYVECWKICQIFFAEALAASIANYCCFLMDMSEPNVPIVAGFIAGASFYIAIWCSFPVSGAHINPILTLATLITRRLPPYLAPVYLVADFLGTLLAMVIASSVTPFADQKSRTYGMTLPGKGFSDLAATITEAWITFVLVTVVLASLDELRAREWRPEYGAPFPLAILLTVVINVVTTAHISGTSMNPARSLAAAIIQNNYDRLWIYFVGPIFGTIVACFFYELVICPKASLQRTHRFLCSKSFDRKNPYD